jgi:[acyl-carrier-protein] S-malonyltransferase
MSLDPKQSAFIFPGQGSQAIGMGRLLAQEDPIAAEVFKTADKILGYSLSQVCWDGPQETLNDTLYTQPALLTDSIAVLRVFESRYPDFIPAITAGHSLGEFTALVKADALSFPEALKLVEERARCMSQASIENPGSMAAVLGLEADFVEQICERASEESGAGVWIANDNCPGQIVISGFEDPLNLASEMLLENGAKKVVHLAVSIAGHSPIMHQAATSFERVLQTTPIQDPKITIVGNVSAKPLQSASEVKEELHAQLISRVRWTESVQYMLDNGITHFFEMGSKSVLTGLLRRIDRDAKGLSLNSPESFAALAEILK